MDKYKYYIVYLDGKRPNEFVTAYTDFEVLEYVKKEGYDINDKKVEIYLKVY